jgi:N-acetylmuramoyl-L-alanine amidase
MKKLIAAVLVNTIVATSVYASGIVYAEKQEQEKQLECLALNVYFETHARSLADSMAVTDVVLNRVESTRYPNTPCDVIHQGYKKGNRYCQFSWYCDGKSDTPHDDEAWEKSRKFARDMYIHGEFRGITEGATHYHATYSKPFWSKKLNRIARIGAHIFYWEK